jgi:high-affinity iron transporter
MLSTFIIALREGLEAALIVGILLSYLVKSEQTHLRRALAGGVAGAIALSFALGGVLTFSSHRLTERGEEAFAGITSLMAVGFVTWMVFWMKRTARSLRKELESKVGAAVQMGAIAVATTAFFAVAREGLETSLFIYTNFQTVRSSAGPLVGLALGLAVAIFLGVKIYQRAINLNLGKFFTFTGVALVIVAAGVLSHGIADLQALGWLPGGTSVAWDLSGVLDENSLPAALLAGSIGFSAITTWLQISIWTLYIALVLTTYLRKPAKVAVAQ